VVGGGVGSWAGLAPAQLSGRIRCIGLFGPFKGRGSMPRLSLSSTFVLIAAFIAVIPCTFTLAQSGDRVGEGGSVVAPPNATAPLKRTSVPFDVKKIEASVCKIYTMRKKGIGTGTGFLVNGPRILVTNYHVVAGGEKYCGG